MKRGFPVAEPLPSLPIRWSRFREREHDRYRFNWPKHFSKVYPLDRTALLNAPIAGNQLKTVDSGSAE